MVLFIYLFGHSTIKTLDPPPQGKVGREEKRTHERDQPDRGKLQRRFGEMIDPTDAAKSAES